MDKKQAIKNFLKEFLNIDDYIIEKETLNVSSLKIYAPKNIIFMEGDEANTIYYALSGIIKLSRISEKGKETIIGTVSANEIFAAVAACNNSVYPVTATVLKKSEILAIDIKSIKKMTEQNPDFIMRLFAHAVDRIKYLLTTIDNLTWKNTRERLEIYLQKLSETAAKKGIDKFKLPLTKQDLALLLGTTPETLSRIFTKLKEENLMEEVGKFIKYGN